MDWKERMEDLIRSHVVYTQDTFKVCGISPSSDIYTALTFWYKDIARHFFSHAIEDVKLGKINIHNVTL